MIVHKKKLISMVNEKGNHEKYARTRMCKQTTINSSSFELTNFWHEVTCGLCKHYDPNRDSRIKTKSRLKKARQK